MLILAALALSMAQLVEAQNDATLICPAAVNAAIATKNSENVVSYMVSKLQSMGRTDEQVVVILHSCKMYNRGIIDMQEGKIGN